MSAQKSPSKQEKTLNLASLYEISNVLGATYDLDKLLGLVFDTILKQTNADSGSLMMLDAERRELRIHAYKGISANIAKKSRIKVGQIVSGIVAQTKKPLLIDNTNFEAIFKKKPRRKIFSSLSIPLIVSDKLIGVINLNRISASDKFTNEDLEAISKFAKDSAIAIHNAKLYIEAEEKIQYLFRFNVISCALNAALSQEKLIDVLSDCMSELFLFDFYTLLLIEKNNYSLLVCSANTIDKSCLNQLKENLALVISGLKKQRVTHKKITLITKKIKSNSPLLKKAVRANQVRSVLNAPVVTKGSTLGMLSMYSLKDRGFNQKDQQSLSTLANQAAVALENAHLYKSLRTTYLSTIRALAQAIEEKDLYTRGHSELVSYYAVKIAEAMQLPQKHIESIQIAGILHDVGKIGIPGDILRKTSSLTDKEYKVIKDHPIIGKRILHPVEFFWSDITEAEPTNKATKKKIEMNKKMLKTISIPLAGTIEILKSTDLSEDIKTMIYHHHEKFGGGGYPKGIKGNAIPIGARILAVADTFEAMTADRPYRTAFSVKKAIGLLKGAAPHQLDPKIVDLFIELVKKKWIVVK